MTSFALYRADCMGQPGNCMYPHAELVESAEDLQRAVRMDYVCAEYRNGYRSKENFLRANCIGLDCDNDHSDDPADWVTPDTVRDAFPGMALAVHYSRHHMKPKNGKAARPKFHCFLPSDAVTNADECTRLKSIAHQIFPYFDTRALDAARFFFGTDNPQVEFFPGDMNFDAFVNFYYPELNAADTRPNRVIPEGSRNSTLSHFAGRVLKRLGDTEAAHNAFMERAAMCEPPLDESELKTIWRSAQNFYQRISHEEGYVPPEQWTAERGSGQFTYDPDDHTDVGQARMLGKHFAQELRYSPATDFICYDGACWQETKPGAQAVAHKLTDYQLDEALTAIDESKMRMKANGAQGLIDKYGPKKAADAMNDAQHEAFMQYMLADSYYKFALKRRESKNVTATLKEARPVLEIEHRILDKDWFLLCTPNATYDLRKGMDGAREHDPEDYITKMTSYSPSDRGMSLWLDALDTFFCCDKALIQYVQRVAGIVCVGQVFLEAMIIAYGDGRNGKSTFWNTIARVLGNYSGNMSADALTVNCRRNVKPEMAETKGKRLLIAAELEEGARLNTSMVKQLCSTDAIYGEKKYKDPFSFTPSHTLVLYTNHLPKVGAKDTGIWRRLIVIPFKAKIEGKHDIKNFTEYLCENAGEAIMKWMIEGAYQAIELGFKIPFPACVTEAVEAYKAENDWLGHFLDECCEIGKNYEVRSGELYAAYRTFSTSNGEYVRGTADFYSALESEGFVRQRRGDGRVIVGLRVNSVPDDEFPDFLS